MESPRSPAPAAERGAGNLGEFAYREIKERLLRGAYRPGHKMTVRAIAQELGLSSTPAREALNRLTTEGALVYSGPKTVIVPILDFRALQEVTLTRLALEGLAAEQAARHGKPEDVETLRALQVQINRALDEERFQDALWHNKEFHFLIYQLSGMPQLVSIIESLWLRIGPSLHDLYPEFAQTRNGVRNHEVAMEALGEHDAPNLRAAMETDIRDGFRSMRKAQLARGE